jgi:hypothetical protein
VAAAVVVDMAALEVLEVNILTRFCLFDDLNVYTDLKW